MDKLAISIPEAARLIGVSKNWMWRAVWRGEIPTVRVGHGRGRRLIRVETLEAYLKEREVKN